MVKIVALIKRRPGLNREEFSRYWATIHGPLAVGPKGPPAVKRYTHTDWLVQPDGTPAPFDGVAEMWFDDRPGLQACLDHFLGEAFPADGVSIGLIDGTVNGVGRLVRWFAARLRRVQTGYVRVGAVSVLFGALLILVLMLAPMLGQLLGQ